jgi:hypothetical protein
MVLDAAHRDEESGSGDDGASSGGGSRRKPKKEVSLTDPQAAWVARKGIDPFCGPCLLLVTLHREGADSNDRRCFSPSFPASSPAMT